MSCAFHGDNRMQLHSFLAVCVRRGWLARLGSSRLVSPHVTVEVKVRVFPRITIGVYRAANHFFRYGGFSLGRRSDCSWAIL